MNVATYVFGIICALLVLAVIVDMLRRGRLRERHAIWWLVGGALGLIVGAFPVVLERAATMVGVEVPANLVFFVSIGLLFLVHIQQSTELTLLESRSRSMAEAHALLEIRVRNLEAGSNNQS